MGGSASASGSNTHSGFGRDVMTEGQHVMCMLVSGDERERERERELSRAVCHLPRAECGDCIWWK